jgi:hypothetical protein
MRLDFNNPFEAEGRWYKGNLHAHTLNSDGHMTAGQLASHYYGAGYDFLSITDHGVLTDTQGLSEPGFLMIPGEEISVGSSWNGRLIHIVGVNIAERLPFKDFDASTNPQEAIDAIVGAGGTAVIAHPHWSDLTHRDLRGLRGHIGLEVYNSTCDLTIGRGYSSAQLDALLAQGHRLYSFAVDDTHGLERPYLPFDICRAWIIVRAEGLTAECIMGGITEGYFFSSNGPSINDVSIDGSEIHVSSSPARSIAFISDGARGANNTVDEGVIEEASYIVEGYETYIRIEVTDWIGRKAWLNPVYVG